MVEVINRTSDTVILFKSNYNWHVKNQRGEAHPSMH